MQTKSFANQILNKEYIYGNCDTGCNHFMFIEPNGKRIHHITLNMNDASSVKTPIKFKQYDYGSSYIYVKLANGDIPLDLSGVSIVGSFKDSRGNIFVDDSNQPIMTNAKSLESDSGVILLPIPKKILKSRGRVRCEIVLFDSQGSRLTSPSFSFYIEESILKYEIDDPGISPDKKAICGEVVCGEVKCGEGLDKTLDETSANTSLDKEFLQRFGGI